MKITYQASIFLFLVLVSCTTIQSEECKNMNSICSSIQKSMLCSLSGMKIMCAKKCGVCTTTTSDGEECKNLDSGCSSVPASNCVLANVKKACPKKCGVCTTTTTTTSDETATKEEEETAAKEKEQEGNCNGIDMTDDIIDQAVADTGACKVVEVMKSIQDATLCNLAQTNVRGAATTLYQKGMDHTFICDLISDVLQLGILFPPEQCTQILDGIMKPVMEGGDDFTLDDVRNTVETQLDGIVTAAVTAAEETVDTFNSFIESINVCPTLNLNPHIWKARIEDVFQLIAAIKKLSDMGPEIAMKFADTVANRCDTYSVIFSVEIGALAILGVEQGIYVTWQNGDGVQEVGLVNGVSAGYNVDPDLDISIGVNVAILIGDKNVWGEWGYTLDVGASVPIYGVGAGVSMGLVFGADGETKALGNFLGFTMGLDFSLGESSTTVDFDLSVSCGYAAATSFKETMGGDEGGQCLMQTAGAVDDLLESLEETKQVFSAKVDELERCGKMYACEAKQCAYGFHGDNYRDCQQAAGKCSEGFEECTKWQYTCEVTSWKEIDGNECQSRECKSVTSTTCSKYLFFWRECTETTEQVCEGACLVWNKILTPIVKTTTQSAKCVGDGVVEVLEKTECVEHLPVCGSSAHCYIGQSVVSASECVGGMVIPGEDCLQENGFL